MVLITEGPRTQRRKTPGNRGTGAPGEDLWGGPVPGSHCCLCECPTHSAASHASCGQARRKWCPPEAIGETCFPHRFRRLPPRDQARRCLSTLLG